MTVRCSGCGSSLSDEASVCEQCGGSVTTSGPSPREPFPVEQPAEAEEQSAGERTGATDLSTASPPDTSRHPQVGRAATFQLPDLSNRRLWVVVAAVAVLAVVAVLGVRAALQERTPPAEEAVATFFASLEKRDAKAALAQLEESGGGVGADPPSDALLADKALRSRSYQPPKHVEVGQVSEASDGDGVIVHVSYTVAGRNVTRSLSLRLEQFDQGSETTERWVIDKWGRQGVTGALHIEPGAPEYEVNDVAVVTDDNTQTIAGREQVVLTAFPGTYRVGVPDNPLVGAKPQRVSVLTSGDVRELTVDAALKESGVAEVRKQVKSFLDRCAAQAQLSPRVGDRKCPFSSFGSVEGPDENQRDITWTIEEYPTYDVELQTDRGDVYASQGGEREDQGVVRLSYEADDGFTGKSKRASQEIRFQVNGPVQVKKAAITWTPA